METYQEALDRIKTLIDIASDKLSVKGKALVMESVDILQELVNKATPKKVNKYRRHTKLEPTYFCPICENIVEKEHKYCTECGQALDWSDEDD